jgi:tRNA pseudouridine38-40 synthase
VRNIRLVLEYDGTDLSGWQRQENAPTVQQHLEEALEAMVLRPVRVTGASRTDAGVHARGQVANFVTESEIPLYGFRRGLNGALPPSIAVVDIGEAPAEFNARFSSRGKHYCYSILAREDRSPMASRFVWHRPHSLDASAMRAAAVHLVGEHDFAGFRATGCQAQTTRRTVAGVDVEVLAGGRVDVHVRGNGFLRNMVRILAGTLVAVGEGRLQADEIPAIIASRDRDRAGQTAPARGLCLVEVTYPALDEAAARNGRELGKLAEDV